MSRILLSILPPGAYTYAYADKALLLHLARARTKSSLLPHTKKEGGNATVSGITDASSVCARAPRRRVAPLPFLPPFPPRRLSGFKVAVRVPPAGGLVDVGVGRAGGRADGLASGSRQRTAPARHWASGVKLCAVDFSVAERGFKKCRRDPQKGAHADRAGLDASS